ncbi:hypothetical protein [Pseudomonas sp. NPDC086251]
MKGNAAPGVVRTLPMLGPHGDAGIVRSDHATLVPSDDVDQGTGR